MNPVSTFLLSVAGIFLIGAVGEIIFQKTNIPDVIWLILAGILLGPISGIVTRDSLDAIAPYFAAITLVVVLFEGGSALRLGELSRAAPRSGLLALVGFTVSVLAIAVVSKLAALVGWLPDTWTWTHGFMLGAILGGSSSIIIMPAMAQARVEAKLANLVNLESALTDALCVVGTSALVDVMVHGSTGAAGPAVSLLRSFGIGVVIGLVAGLIWVLFLRFLKSSEHAYPITLSALLILYVVIDHLGGSAAMGILTVAVILGNAPAISRKIGLSDGAELDRNVRGFHRQMAFIIKSFFFVFIGAMLGPPWKFIVFGVLLGGVLFAARIPSVFLATLGSGLDKHQKQMITVSLPRGMAAGVLATLPVTAHIVGTEHLPVVVFACVFTSILVFAGGFPVVRRRSGGAASSAPGEIQLPAGAAMPAGLGIGAIAGGMVGAPPPFVQPGYAAGAPPAGAPPATTQPAPGAPAPYPHPGSPAAAQSGFEPTLEQARPAYDAGAAPIGQPYPAPPPPAAQQPYTAPAGAQAYPAPPGAQPYPAPPGAQPPAPPGAQPPYPAPPGAQPPPPGPQPLYPAAAPPPAYGAPAPQPQPERPVAPAPGAPVERTVELTTTPGGSNGNDPQQR